MVEKQTDFGETFVKAVTTFSAPSVNNILLFTEDNFWLIFLL